MQFMELKMSKSYSLKIINGKFKNKQKHFHKTTTKTTAATVAVFCFYMTHISSFVFFFVFALSHFFFFCFQILLLFSYGGSFCFRFNSSFLFNVVKEKTVFNCVIIPNCFFFFLFVLNFFLSKSIVSFAFLFFLVLFFVYIKEI